MADDTAQAGDQGEVFISYARADREIAGELAAYLQAGGVSVWWDYNLTAGSVFSDEIRRRLDAASHVIVLWSPSSVASHFVQDEAEYARRQGKLLPYKIADCDLPIGFGRLHTADLRRFPADFDVIFARLGRRPPAPAAQPATEAAVTATTPAEPAPAASGPAPVPPSPIAPQPDRPRAAPAAVESGVQQSAPLSAAAAHVAHVAGPTLRPPRSEVGVVGWLQKNLFSSWSNGLLTLLGLYVTWRITAALLDWAVFSAVWTGEDGSVCRAEAVGACWPFVTAKFSQFMFGRYPDAERWRVLLTYGLTAVTLLSLMIPPIPGKKWWALFGIIVLPVASWALLYGGVAGLPVVETELWGGLLVTLVVATVGIAGSFPIGIILALGRRSQMPIARWVSIFFIEVVRAVPLITILFMSSVMLPLFLPDGVSFDKLLRALIGVMLFSGAYMAETIRGGLQAIPRGQYEAADSLGLSFPQKMGLIILPQALKMVIPGIVNSFVGLAKDTSLVLIIGIFDLLGIVQAGLTDAKWFAHSTHMTGYIFAAAIFWIICFGISRYSAWLERRLSAGDAR